MKALREDGSWPTYLLTVVGQTGGTPTHRPGLDSTARAGPERRRNYCAAPAAGTKPTAPPGWRDFEPRCRPPRQADIVTPPPPRGGRAPALVRPSLPGGRRTAGRCAAGTSRVKTRAPVLPVIGDVRTSL